MKKYIFMQTQIHSQKNDKIHFIHAKINSQNVPCALLKCDCIKCIITCIVHHTQLIVSVTAQLISAFVFATRIIQFI